MNFGLHLPSAGEFADIKLLVTLSREAEEFGWDGFFLYDQVATAQGEPLLDPWTVLSAVAMSTQRLKLGPLVTPLARRRPWQVARQAVALDHLSGGRLILGIGLGSGIEEFEALGEEGDPRRRAAMLDEGLELLTRCWSGERFTYKGMHYTVTTDGFQPTSVQKPRIPLWVGGIWPHRAPFRRAARWDGAFPHYHGPDGPAMIPQQAISEMRAYMSEYRRICASVDIVIRNKQPTDDLAREAETAASYAAVGVTWWLEGVEGRPTAEAVRRRIQQGPPGQR